MKRYLLSLLLVCVGFVSFCSSNFITSYTVVNNNAGTTQSNFLLDGVNPGSSVVFENYIPGYKSAISISCNSRCSAALPDGSNISFNYVDLRNFSYFGSVIYFNDSCSSNSCRIYMYSGASITYSLLSGVQYPSSSSSCPEVDTGSILSGYVLESELLFCQGDLSSCNSSLSGCNSSLNSCNSNLSGCMTNLDNYSSSLNTCSSNLNNCNTSLSSCMSSNCPVSSGNVSWSSLFINNIQHLGAPIIDITIPEEFDWDYVSTDEEFTLDIEGYNVDTEYMDGIITTQTTLPNDVDFNNIISSVVPLFVPGIVIIFFLYFIFRFIKKIF